MVRDNWHFASLTTKTICRSQRNLNSTSRNISCSRKLNHERLDSKTNTGLFVGYINCCNRFQQHHPFDRTFWCFNGRQKAYALTYSWRKWYWYWISRGFWKLRSFCNAQTESKNILCNWFGQYRMLVIATQPFIFHADLLRQRF